MNKTNTGTKLTEAQAMNVVRLVAALRRNADAYHDRVVSHARFSARQDVIWSEIKALGLREEVLTSLREVAK